ncbi:unnamed protein product [Heligmosomoides polygyrus]|uniref:Transposase n=1 Tax=Heligmosomoides polygyrus TaxID=6339 RepID=A0A183F341_HELPZ|nr:unnamed protein product [Heligmosomoides polygyrus]
MAGGLKLSRTTPRTFLAIELIEVGTDAFTPAAALALKSMESTFLSARLHGNTREFPALSLNWIRAQGADRSAQSGRSGKIQSSPG